MYLILAKKAVSHIILVEKAIPESILFVFWNVAEALIYNTDNII